MPSIDRPSRISSTPVGHTGAVPANIEMYWIFGRNHSDRYQLSGTAEEWKYTCWYQVSPRGRGRKERSRSGRASLAPFHLQEGSDMVRSGIPVGLTATWLVWHLSTKCEWAVQEDQVRLTSVSVIIPLVGTMKWIRRTMTDRV